jgi:sigma-B regulation protein RsbU (phosphoserine phosphatase)
MSGTDSFASRGVLDARPSPGGTPSGRPSGAIIPEQQRVSREAGDGLRQQAIERLSVLGSSRDERFDRLTRLAQKVFAVPITSITLLDNDSVWSLSCAGMARGETPRSESFCDTTVSLGQLLIVEDAREDERFAGLPAVATEPGVRFYAGHPIADPNGIVIGSFCLVGFEPRRLDERERELLAELAGWAQQEMSASADTIRARQVQDMLLPSVLPAFPGYDIAAACIPALTVGGDFYDCAAYDGSLSFCVADVMGKGMGAALITASVRAALRVTARGIARSGRRGPVIYTAGEVLTYTNRVMSGDLERTGALVTVVLGAIDGASGTVRFADAGHGLAVIVGGDGSARWLASPCLPLGVAADGVWTDQEARMEPGDTLLCFSDGLLDVYGSDRAAMAEIARLAHERPVPRELIGHFRDVAAGQLATDDVTALAIRRLPGT